MTGFWAVRYGKLPNGRVMLLVAAKKTSHDGRKGRPGQHAVGVMRTVTDWTPTPFVRACERPPVKVCVCMRYEACVFEYMCNG